MELLTDEEKELVRMWPDHSIANYMPWFLASHDLYVLAANAFMLPRDEQECRRITGGDYMLLRAMALDISVQCEDHPDYQAEIDFGLFKGLMYALAITAALGGLVLFAWLYFFVDLAK